jgi:putative cardiolipin synthase
MIAAARVVLAALCLAASLLGCSQPREVPRTSSQAWPYPGETPLGSAVTAQLAGHDGQSGFRLLESGLDALSMRAGLAEEARRTLDLQYYTLHQDVTTQLLMYRVLRAAERGVRVRLLVDDLYAAGKDLDLATLSSHANIQVRVFNPFLRRGGLGLSRLLEFLGEPARLNRRMHNKLWIADNAAAIVGGRNLGDAYFDASREFDFSDLDVLAVGPVVRDISRSFDEYWNSEWAVPIEAFVASPPGPEQLAAFERRLRERLAGFRDTVYAKALRELRLGPRLLAGELPLTPAVAEALHDPPSKVVGAGGESASRIFASRLRSIVEAARKEVILISPYFIPSERGVGILSALVRRGVQVRILTNSLASTDVPLVHAGYARYRERLLAAGVTLYEMRPEARPRGVRSWKPGASTNASLHAKAIIVDRQQVLVGSMNFDPRSRQDNTESALLLQSAQLGANLGALFDEAVRPDDAYRVVLAGPGTLNWIAEQDGKEVRYDREPAGWWRRFLSALFARFAPEDLL